VVVRGSALNIPLADKSVHCVITSPPYWGLRDYGVLGQLGLEKTPEEYVANMVQVFREVWRVLRDDGTLWLNLGDSYAANRAYQVHNTKGAAEHTYDNGSCVPDGLKPKDLVGIPWRVAFALQADGWYLRSDIIWSKPNPMPESVTDRPTKAHEYVFLLSKSEKYFFDQEAVREADSGQQHDRKKFNGAPSLEPSGGLKNPHGNLWGTPDKNGAGRNIRTVWTIATQPFPEAHFATFPEKLVEPCLKAGTSERGVCPKCGAPWVREIERTGHIGKREPAYVPNNTPSKMDSTGWAPATRGTDKWKPSCYCGEQRIIPAVVLDPFAGACTVGVVAQKLNRRFVALELKMDYCRMGMKRIQNTDVAML
jgi:DNA modification methylase